MTGSPTYRPELLRAERTRRGWTQPKLIYALRQVAALEGRVLPPDATMKRYVARWENGHAYPAEYVSLLVQAYDTPADALGLADPATPEAAPPVDYPGTADESIDAIASLWRADLASAQGLLAAEPDLSAWHSAPLAWLVSADGTPLPGARVRSQVGMADVEAVRATVDMFVDMDNRFGGGHGRRSLIQYLDSDVRDLLAARSTEQVGRALFSTVAEGTLLAAWMSYDSGHHGLAQRYFVQALRLAQTADDRRLAGSVLSAMSHQATFLGRYAEAANLARAAVLGTQRHGTATMTAQFHAMEARALARLNDQAGCSRALAEATSIFERHNPREDPEFISYFDQAELSAEFGHCFRDLELPGQATTYAEECLGGTDGSYVRSDFFATMVLADALLDHGEPELACRAAMQALTLGRQLKSARCAAYLGEFRTRLDRFAGNATVADFIENARTHRLWQTT
ncbi:helix-turn-helix domain-containing protein [Yinghuangia sp. YIM S09857]|uniref:helix-turn-helix domain-containing protein n=1 Tax=Yinghuangia sp. YIM S09857 TaxID=3436929 RepID=UPI003F539D60